MSKQIYEMLNGTKITAHNEREKQFARIFNKEISDIVEYIDGMEGMEVVAKSLLRDTYNHWMVTDLGGMASAMYYMGMIKEPISNIKIWDMISDEYWKRNGWNY